MKIVQITSVVSNEEVVVHGLSESGCLYTWAYGYPATVTVRRDPYVVSLVNADDIAKAQADGETVEFRPGRTAGWVYEGIGHSTLIVPEEWPQDAKLKFDERLKESRNGVRMENALAVAAEARRGA